MASHMPGGKPGSVTTDIGGLDMTRRNRDLAKRTGAFTAGSGHATRLAAGAFMRVAALRFTGESRRIWPAALAPGQPGPRVRERMMCHVNRSQAMTRGDDVQWPRP
jgi:hypothetical protein